MESLVQHLDESPSVGLTGSPWHPKFEGETVRLGDKEYVIPSLSVKQARRLWPTILKLNEGITEANLPEKYGLAVEVIHAALSRNYPDMTPAEVEDLVEIRNLRKLILIVSGQSGMNGPGLEPGAIKATST